MQLSLPATGDLVPRDSFLIIPSGLLTDGLGLAGVSAAFIYRAVENHPIQLRAGFNRLWFEDAGAEDRSQVFIDAKVPFVQEKAFALTGYGGLARVVDLVTKSNLGAVGEYTAGLITLSGGLEYARKTTEGQETAVEDLIPSTGVFLSMWDGRLGASLDYVFKNDIDGDYDLSFTLNGPIGSGKTTVRAGVARHQTLFIALVRAFGVGPKVPPSASVASFRRR